jgi:hypothetical protein
MWLCLESVLYGLAESQQSIATLVLLGADRSSVRALSPGDHSTATAWF